MAPGPTLAPVVKVLYLLDALSPAGTETSTVQLACHLQTLGVDCVIAVLKPGEHALEDVAVEHGVRVVQIRTTRVPGRLKEIRRLIRLERPGVLHTALFRADQLGRIASIGLDVRVVSSLVNTPYDPARLSDPNVVRWKVQIVRFLDAMTGRFLVDRFHSVSQGVKDANATALHLSSDRIDVVERGRDTSHLGAVDPMRRARIREALGISDEQPIVLSLGRLEHQKAQVDLIQAAQSLRSAYPGLKVLIAGKEGSASGRVASAAAHDDWTASAVDLLGHRTDVGDLLAAADVLAISSHYEGTAGVALEAMSVGVPIVSTNIAGLKGILADGVNAVLVPPGEPAELARGIDRVLTDPELAAQLVERGRCDFKHRFTLDVAAAGMMSFYDRLVASAKSSTGPQSTTGSHPSQADDE